MALTDELRIALGFNGDWLDRSGNGNDVTPNGITLETDTPKIGSGYANGNGTSDGEIADSASLDSDYITVASWVRYTTSGTTVIHERSDGTFGANDWNLITVSGKLRCVMYFAGANRFAESTATYNDGNWHLVIWSYDGSFIRIFVDNVYVGELAAAYGTMGASADPLTLFARKGKVIPFPGSKDAFAMWGRALTFGGVAVGNSATEEVAQVWNAGAGIEFDLTANGFPFFFDRGHY